MSKKIQFDIKYRPQIESGEYKVEIGKSDPWPARIACWDLNGNDLIVIVSNPEGKEEGLIYTPEGKHKAYAPRIDSDLFLITPEPELSEFEKAVEAIYESCNVKELRVKDKAAELLELARKELDRITKENIAKDERFVSHKYSLNPYEIGVKDGYKAGKEDALKDLPRWKKQQYASNGANIYWPTNELAYRGMVIRIDELTKLPGFKEDESHE